jgi:hypothetical protein
MTRVMATSWSKAVMAGVTFHSLVTRLVQGAIPLVAVALSGCGGSAAEPGYPDGPPSKEEAADPSWETEDPNAQNSEPAEAPEEQPTGERKKPEFTEGMTVDAAIAAVPEDYEYIGLDQDVLAKPLAQLDTYQECKVKQSDKFKVRIAVWDGKVVGANVTSHNKVLAQCIDGVVRKLEYKDRVESINTVEYSF